MEGQLSADWTGRAGGARREDEEDEGEDEEHQAGIADKTARDQYELAWKCFHFILLVRLVFVSLDYPIQQDAKQASNHPNFHKHNHYISTLSLTTNTTDITSSLKWSNRYTLEKRRMLLN